jgi:hypothetical protein
MLHIVGQRSTRVLLSVEIYYPDTYPRCRRPQFEGLPIMPHIPHQKIWLSHIFGKRRTEQDRQGAEYSLALPYSKLLQFTSCLAAASIQQRVGTVTKNSHRNPEDKRDSLGAFAALWSKLLTD